VATADGGGTTPAKRAAVGRRTFFKKAGSVAGPAPERGSVKRRNARAAARVQQDHLRASKFCKHLPLESPSLKGFGNAELPEVGGDEKNRLNVFEVRVFNGFLNETQGEFIQKCVEAKARSKYRFDFPESKHPSRAHPSNTHARQTPAHNTN